MPFRRSPRIALVAVLLCCGASARAQAVADPYARARQNLVETAIVGAGIENARVIEAIRRTPRHEFVPVDKRQLAYYDMAIPIGEAQTISPPFVVAYMTQELDPQPSDKVLEIGTGSGYQAAVLSPLVQDVYTIEIVAPLGRRAAATLRRLGFDNVHTKIGDGYQGWPEHAPFDKIIVTCSPEEIPQPLIDQLAEGGRLIVPLGERFNQSLYRFTKKDGRLERDVLQSTFFVPMTGIAEELRQIKSDAPLTDLVNADFEDKFEVGEKPAGWYYVRRGRVESGQDAPSGSHYLTFSNAVSGQNAHSMQAFGVIGREVEALDVSLRVRGEDLAWGPAPHQKPQMLIEFYDSQRAPVGHARVGPWGGSFAWKRETARVDVPADARLAVVGLGLFGATGTISYDDLQIRLPARK